jgi:hypothetical protein
MEPLVENVGDVDGIARSLRLYYCDRCPREEQRSMLVVCQRTGLGILRWRPGARWRKFQMRRPVFPLGMEAHTFIS